MSNIITLDGELRTDFGKGAARQARRAGKIPAVIYGHGTDPVRVLLPAAATTLAVRGSNALLNISVEGEDTITLVKDIQRHALRQTVDHLDLLIVKKGEKVIVEVSVQIQGELTAGSTLSLDHAVIAVEAEAVALPEHVVANIAGLRRRNPDPRLGPGPPGGYRPGHRRQRRRCNHRRRRRGRAGCRIGSFRRVAFPDIGSSHD